MRVFSPTRLRKARSDKKITREALAKSIDRTPWCVRDLEQGKYIPSVPVLLGIADRLKVQVDDLLEEAHGDAISA